MGIKVFITGTDTGVGKTYVSVGLLKKFSQLGYSTLGLKPIASGCHSKSGKFYNADAFALQQASSIKLPYELINPFAFELPIAPNLAAKLTTTKLTTSNLLYKAQEGLNYPSDICLIEGVGGWCVPLNECELMPDFVRALGIPVIVIVAIRLGCLNHALLTVRAINESGTPMLGWVANNIEGEVSVARENIQTLKHWIPAPCLGVIPNKKNPENYINVQPIIDYFT